MMKINFIDENKLINLFKDIIKNEQNVYLIY